MFVLFSISVRFYSSIYFIRFSMNIFLSAFADWWAQTSNHSPTYRVLICDHWSASVWSLRTFVRLVGSSGLEPPTSRLSGARSNHLSYEPIVFSSVSSSLVPQRFSPRWWRWWDSNPWPPACRAGALPAELHPHFVGLSHYLLLKDPSKLNNELKVRILHSLTTDIVFVSVDSP